MEAREARLRKGVTVWFTGLPSSGKSTLARALERQLRKWNLKVELLDGDVVRTHFSKGLGFSKEDRDTNIKRIGFVCHLLTRNDVVAISAAISPYRDIRDYNRKLIGRFVEVYCKCQKYEEICYACDYFNVKKQHGNDCHQANNAYRNPWRFSFIVYLCKDLWQ